MKTLTLEEHFARIRERVERKNVSSLPNLNAFAEEIERARTADLKTIEDKLPKTVPEHYEYIRFYPEYLHTPEDIEDWRLARQMGFCSQLLKGFKAITITDEQGAKTAFLSESKKIEQYGKLLPSENPIFGRILKTHHSAILGITQEDLNPGRDISAPLIVYKLGEVQILQRNREPTREELIKFARPLLVEYIFGVRPAEEELILAQLKKIHNANPNRHWTLRWVKPEELTYPVTKGILSIYADAKESGLFKKLQFGLLNDETRSVKDPVLAGIYTSQGEFKDDSYQEFRIPLAYWA